MGSFEVDGRPIYAGTGSWKDRGRGLAPFVAAGTGGEAAIRHTVVVAQASAIMTPQQGRFGFDEPALHSFAPGAWFLPAFARAAAPELLRELDRIVGSAPFRHMSTPGGRRMSVSMTNCGRFGWVTDERGYRYTTHDPLDGTRRWPAMPTAFSQLATALGAAAGYRDFVPDACLVNRYEPGARMTLHRDLDEGDLRAPIVSVSFGLPATFEFGGLLRPDPTLRLPLAHGDVVVFGGASRRCFHGILPVVDGVHPWIGRARVNLTFRVVG